jgi:hypothetical protein
MVYHPHLNAGCRLEFNTVAICNMLQRWCFKPAEHPLHRLRESFLQLIGARRVKLEPVQAAKNRLLGRS